MIDKFATKVNGLYSLDGDLYLREKKISDDDYHRRITFLFHVLAPICRKILLVAHNASFDVHF